MRKIVLMILLLMMVCGTCFAEKEAKWEYVINMNNTSYSVDMNNINFSNGVMIFWSAMNKHDEEQTALMVTAVKLSEHLYRLEQIGLYDNKTNQRINYSLTPTDWKSIEKDSPIYYIASYIFEHQPKK